MTALVGASETWRAVAGFEGLYEVSNMGRIYSHRRARFLRPHKDADGYLRIGLWNGKVQRKHTVHKLVATAFHADEKNALHNEAAHLDGNRANASADNLKWVSKVENHSHKRRHGTHQAGERHPRARLVEDQVRRIRLGRRSAREAAALFGISRYTVEDIRRGKRWQSITAKG